MLRTTVYIDGFNLYNRKLKHSPHLKWLDVRQLVCNILRPGYIVEGVNYYTARVSPLIDIDAPARQLAYLKALRSREVAIHEGTFSLSEAWAPPVLPPIAKPDEYVWAHPPPTRVKVKIAREKASDVNLASHLIRDGFRDVYDAAIVVSSDSDLCEPIRIVCDELGKRVGVLRPTNKPAQSLKAVASFCIAIREQDLARSQLPSRIDLATGDVVERPGKWNLP